MKTSTQSLPGLISSLLLSTGFPRAAAWFDPLARALALHASVSAVSEACAAPCTYPCQYYRAAESVG